MSQAPVTQRAGAGETVRRERYHLAERVINSACGLAQRAGLPWLDLHRPRLVAAAQRQTGLSDLGDSRFLQGLDRIIGEATGRYTPLGTALLRNLLLQALVNRLRTVGYLQRHPDALEIPIRHPIFVLGFPRSGTTLLQILLAASPDRAPLEFWELMSVTPRIESDLDKDRRVRIRHTDRILRLASLFVPELNRIHHSTATTPEEDWQLLVPSFHALTFVLAYGLDDYGRWLQREADMVWAYRELKQRLQIILHQRPRQQLVMKCPDHLWFMDALLAVFPDACVVQTHRDPVQCLTSYTSLIALQERTLTGHIQWQPLARRLTRTFLEGAQRAQEARRRHPADRFFDVSFEQLVREPEAIVHRIFEHFHLAPTSQHSMQRALDRPRADRPGSHRYSHQRLDIDPEAVRAQFRPFLEVPTPDDPSAPHASSSTPRGARTPRQTSGAVDSDPIPLPITGALDLHTFRPQDVKDLVPEYLAECRQRGIREVRIVHGKGIGTLRRTVHALLQRDPNVLRFWQAHETMGGWGATMVELRPASSPPQAAD